MGTTAASLLVYPQYTSLGVWTYAYTVVHYIIILLRSELEKINILIQYFCYCVNSSIYSVYSHIVQAIEYMYCTEQLYNF